MSFSIAMARSSGIACLLSLAVPAALQAQTPAIVEFHAGGRLQQGLPLVDYAHELIVIGRDGWMHSLDPRKPEAMVRHLEGQYKPASAVEIRDQLRTEFGDAFEVIATQNFLVVQPQGRGDRWPRLFESSHRAFTHYMTKRGVNVRPGRFPMVAVVFPDQQAMYAEFKRLDIDVSRVSGLYSGNSNRVMTHDGGNSAEIAATVRHEAAHQSAFNWGVHSRVNDTPRWISEGVGQMFEPSAMTGTLAGTQLIDRVNLDAMSYIKANYQGRHDARFSEAVMQLVSDDQLFTDSKRIDEAYAVSWAMMFYLAERRPTTFATLLNHIATRPPFREYTRADRLRDFERIVEADTLEFSREVGRFLQSL
jgi:hypothetical protein